MVAKGACLSRISDRHLSNCSENSDKVLAGWVYKEEDLISEEKFSTLIEENFLIVFVSLVEVGELMNGNLKRTAEWSERQGSTTSTSDMLLAVLDIRRSRVWPAALVGEATCWHRSKVSSRVRNWDE